MSNILNIAHKEFSDLLSSRPVIYAIIVYVIILLGSLYNDVIMLNSSAAKDQLVLYMINSLSHCLCTYGSLIAVVLGFASMVSEIENNSLSNLAVKPLYRDSIINGKMIGVMGFLFCIFMAVSVVYMSATLLLIGDLNVDILISLANSSAIIIFMSLLAAIFFCSFSMLATILLKEPSFSLFVSIIFLYVMFWILPNMEFAWYIGALFGDISVSSFITGLSPGWTMTAIGMNSLYCNSLVIPISDIVKFALYSIITTIACYIAFLKRDIV